MRHVATAIWSLYFLLIAAPPAEACTCVESVLRAEYSATSNETQRREILREIWRRDVEGWPVVFLGQVTAIDGDHATLRVERSWKGDPEPQVTVALGTGTCRFAVRLDRRYLVFASYPAVVAPLLPSRQLTTNICSPTKEMTASDDEAVAWLDEWKRER